MGRASYSDPIKVKALNDKWGARRKSILKFVMIGNGSIWQFLSRINLEVFYVILQLQRNYRLLTKNMKNVNKASSM